MTGFLASVQSIAEARTAFQEGADIIDLKAPARGALGAVSFATMRGVVGWVQGRRPVSAATGDLPAIPSRVRRTVAETAATGVAFVKVGFFECDRRAAVLAAVEKEVQQGARVVGVLFADRESSPVAALRAFADHGLVGAMVDTAEKRGRGLRAYLDEAELAAFVQECRRLGLFAGLAGSLQTYDIEPLMALGPHYLGFRGVLCGQYRRTGALDPQSVKHIRMRISAYRVKIPKPIFRREEACDGLANKATRRDVFR